MAQFSRTARDIPNRLNGVKENELRGSRDREQSRDVGPPLDIQISAFMDRDFSPETYVQKNLPSLSEDTVRVVHSTLAEAKDTAASDLQRSIYRNYNEFIAISKEVSRLESDVLVLRGLLGDLKTINENLREDAGFDRSPGAQNPDLNDSSWSTGEGLDRSRDKGDRDRDREDQVAADRVYEVVDGLSVRALASHSGTDPLILLSLQKLLPPTPTRRLLRDTSAFYEVSTTSFKQKQSVQMFLFSDSLVVCTRRRNLMGSGKGRMQAERYWMLSEIAVIDMKDSAEVTNGLKIMKHPDVFIFRCDALEIKKQWLSALKKATDDNVMAWRKERDAGGKQALMGMTSTSKQNPASNPDTVPMRKHSLVGKVHSMSAPAARDQISVMDMRWLTELPDELDVSIALREFDEAVEQTDKAKLIISQVTTESARVRSLRLALEERVTRLAAVISQELSNPLSTRAQVKCNIDRLLRLGLGEQAREIFLTARSSLIKHRVRQLQFDGDITQYIAELAVVVFTIIRNTCDWYTSSFKESGMASGFLKWVKTEIEQYAAIFRRQIFDAGQNFAVIADCLQATVEQSRTLREVGLDLNFMLEHLFLDDILNAIDAYGRRCYEAVVASIAKDTLAIVPSEDKAGELQPGLKVTQSAYTFYDVVVEFMNDMSLLVTLSLYEKIVSSFVGLFNGYLTILSESVKNSLMKDGQVFAIMCDEVFVVDEFLPRIIAQLSHRFDRPIPELEELLTVGRTLVAHTMETYCVWRSANLTQSEIFPFERMDYSSNKGISESARPSESITRLILEIHNIAVQIESPPLEKFSILATLIEQLLAIMLEPKGWENSERPGEPRAIGFGGVQQLVLDVHFFLRVCETYVTERANEMADDVCERGLRIYLQGKKSTAQLKLDSDAPSLIPSPSAPRPHLPPSLHHPGRAVSTTANVTEKQEKDSVNPVDSDLLASSQRPGLPSQASVVAVELPPRKERQLDSLQNGFSSSMTRNGIHEDVSGHKRSEHMDGTTLGGPTLKQSGGHGDKSTSGHSSVKTMKPLKDDNRKQNLDFKPSNKPPSTSLPSFHSSDNSTKVAAVAPAIATDPELLEVLLWFTKPLPSPVSPTLPIWDDSIRFSRRRIPDAATLTDSNTQLKMTQSAQIPSPTTSDASASSLAVAPAQSQRMSPTLKFPRSTQPPSSNLVLLPSPRPLPEGASSPPVVQVDVKRAQSPPQPSTAPVPSPVVQARLATRAPQDDSDDDGVPLATLLSRSREQGRATDVRPTGRVDTPFQEALAPKEEKAVSVKQEKDCDAFSSPTLVNPSSTAMEPQPCLEQPTVTKQDVAPRMAVSMKISKRTNSFARVVNPLPKLELLRTSPDAVAPTVKSHNVTPLDPISSSSDEDARGAARSSVKRVSSVDGEFLEPPRVSKRPKTADAVDTPTASSSNNHLVNGADSAIAVKRDLDPKSEFELRSKESRELSSGLRSSESKTLSIYDDKKEPRRRSRSFEVGGRNRRRSTSIGGIRESSPDRGSSRRDRRRDRSLDSRNRRRRSSSDDRRSRSRSNMRSRSPRSPIDRRPVNARSRYRPRQRSSSSTSDSRSRERRRKPRPRYSRSLSTDYSLSSRSRSRSTSSSSRSRRRSRQRTPVPRKRTPLPYAHSSSEDLEKDYDRRRSSPKRNGPSVAVTRVSGKAATAADARRSTVEDRTSKERIKRESSTLDTGRTTHSNAIAQKTRTSPSRSSQILEVVDRDRKGNTPETTQRAEESSAPPASTGAPRRILNLQTYKSRRTQPEAGAPSPGGSSPNPTSLLNDGQSRMNTPGSGSGSIVSAAPANKATPRGPPITATQMMNAAKDHKHDGDDALKQLKHIPDGKTYHALHYMVAATYYLEADRMQDASRLEPFLVHCRESVGKTDAGLASVLLKVESIYHGELVKGLVRTVKIRVQQTAEILSDTAPATLDVCVLSLTTV
ncbi:exocyst complex component exo84 [Gonapodya sp. JEL0774]|nr:exocyst complex component exo84 [Gonapodya sp. JEL0774]